MASATFSEARRTLFALGKNLRRKDWLSWSESERQIAAEWADTAFRRVSPPTQPYHVKKLKPVPRPENCI